MANSNIMIVNNTGTDISWLIPVFIDCVRNGSPIPEEVADLFILKVIEVSGQKRGIVDFA